MTKTIDLNGKWALRWYDGERGPQNLNTLEDAADQRRAITATVPGSVHLDLMKAGWIKDPNEGINVLECRWVEERYWYYRREFNAPALKAAQKAFLVFDGLDLAASIHLNGKEVGSHANAFYPCRVDVTSSLLKGANVLVVKLDSGIFHTMDRSADGLAVNLSSRLTKRPWLRKTQSSHNWDWSPRLLNVGIHGGVRLEIVEAFRFDQSSVLAEVSEDCATGTVTARMHLEGLEDRPVKAVLLVEVAEAKAVAKAEVEIRKGACRAEVKVSIPRPRLWWPIGHGAQNRYTVKVSLLPARGGRVEVVRKVGFRRVRVIQDPHPETGRHFTIEVNGRKIFCKGGNFVPADMIFARIDRERYRVLVDRAIEANSNFMRVWGGGLYEHEDFYEECDRRGMLVWQEFIFACAKYPTIDEKFLADIKREAEFQVRRLAHRPSLVVWCGNNEMEWGNYGWGYEKGVAHPDHAFFHMVLPRILAENDRTRYYQPSSPISPGFEDPNSPTVGDQHPWSVGFGNTDFREYRKMVCRFPNEGGILGPNAFPTVLACLPPDQRRIGSLAWEAHDNSVSYWTTYQPDRMFKQWLGMDASKLSMEEYVYWGGVMQGEGLTEYIRNFHRRMFSSSSAIFWMYNDCWPTVRSWTTVDYYLRRTPAFHPVRRAFAPVNCVVVAEDGAKDVLVFGVNETSEPVRAMLRFGVFTLAGKYPVDRYQPVVLPPVASTPVASFPRRMWTAPRESAAFAVMTSADGNVIARDRLILPLYKEMRWPRANVRMTCRRGKATFTSDTFAWRVCLDLDGERKLTDNFFDVYPGQPYTIEWPFRTPPKVMFVGNLA